MVTFPDALAALTAALGEPADVYVVSACARVWWAMAWDGESDDESGVLLAETHAGTVEIAAMRGVAAERRWTLAGDTPLADAVREAAAWLGGRGVSPQARER